MALSFGVNAVHAYACCLPMALSLGVNRSIAPSTVGPFRHQSASQGSEGGSVTF